MNRRRFLALLAGIPLLFKFPWPNKPPVTDFSSLRGKRAMESRPQLIIVDDPEPSPEYSEAKKRKMLEFFVESEKSAWRAYGYEIS